MHSELCNFSKVILDNKVCKIHNETENHTVPLLANESHHLKREKKCVGITVSAGADGARTNKSFLYLAAEGEFLDGNQANQTLTLLQQCALLREGRLISIEDS